MIEREKNTNDTTLRYAFNFEKNQRDHHLYRTWFKNDLAKNHIFMFL